MPSAPWRISREFVVDALKTITTANGYGINVNTVELYGRGMRTVDPNECPAIIVYTHEDNPVDNPTQETMGGNQGNRHRRNWRWILDLLIPDPDQSLIHDVADEFLQAVEKCLLANRINTTNHGMPLDIRIGKIDRNHFEVTANGVVLISMEIFVRYDFTRNDL